MQECKQDTSARLRALSIGLALFAAQAAFSLAHAQTSYTLTSIGSLGGGQTEVKAINNLGEVVGCSLAVVNGTNVTRAFVYRNGLMMDIGSLANGGTACANDINDTSVITGSSATATGEQRAFIYINGTMTSLGNLGTSSVGNSINNANVIAGSANDVNGNPVGAFRYDARSTPSQVALGQLGGIITQGRSINTAGDIAGWAVNATFQGTSFLFKNGAFTDLGNVLGFPSQAQQINDPGQIIGTTQTDGYVVSNGVVTILPGLGGNGSAPYGINNKSQVVGSSWTAAGTHAFVFSQGQITDLNNVIDPSSPDKPFVTLESGAGINENGWIIAHGLDSRTGVRGGYLLRPVP